MSPVADNAPDWVTNFLLVPFLVLTLALDLDFSFELCLLFTSTLALHLEVDASGSSNTAGVFKMDANWTEVTLPSSLKSSIAVWKPPTHRKTHRLQLEQLFLHHNIMQQHNAVVLWGTPPQQVLWL